MGNHKWTSGEEKLLVDSILAGCSRADICDKLGLSESVVYNHYRAVRATDKTLPMFPRAEKTVVVSADQAEPHKTKEKKAELNPLEKQMADIIAEQKEIIDNLRVELETEQEARELEAEAYRNEVKRLTDQINALRGTVSAQGDEMEAKDKLIKKLYEERDEARRGRDEATRSDLLRDAQDQLHDVMDHVMDLNAEVHKRDELIVAMAKAIFLGEKEVLLA